MPKEAAMNFVLADGDTINPMIFATHGISSPHGTALNTYLSILRGEQTLADVIDETANLLSDCDECHTRALVKFHGNETAHALAVQWALVAPKLHALVSEVKVKEGSEDEKRELSLRVSVIYDLLLTRLMTFVLNGIT